MHICNWICECIYTYIHILYICIYVVLGLTFNSHVCILTQELCFEF